MSKEIVFPLIPPQSRYIRNTWMTSTKKMLNFSDNSCIRYFDESESFRLSEMVRKRNIFARHSYENNFYINRIRELANHTIIEVFRSGDPQEIREEAERVANLVEKLVILSSVLVINKNTLLRKLGISTKSRNELDIIIGSEIQYISSKFQGVSFPDGIELTDASHKRFKRCGFFSLYDYCLLNNDLAKRVNSSLDWLFESRREPSIYASIIKTSIALEALLIFTDSENLSKSLSDRVAYILSPFPDVRQKLSKIISQFYNIRSSIIHGNRKKDLRINPLIIEAIDRICILIYLTISSNSNLWTSEHEFRQWFEKKHWGYNVPDLHYPFSKIYLNNILKLNLK
jgi:hypothetical protein